jgi:hypothetical protein
MKVFTIESTVMGFKNALWTMQRTMNEVLDYLRGKGVEVYIDYMVIHAVYGMRHDELF